MRLWARLRHRSRIVLDKEKHPRLMAGSVVPLETRGSIWKMRVCDFSGWALIRLELSTTNYLR